MIQFIFAAAIVLFSTAIALSLLRILKGPTLPDRVVAFDVIGVNLISIVAVLSVVLESLFRSHFDYRYFGLYQHCCFLQVY